MLHWTASSHVNEKQLTDKQTSKHRDTEREYHSRGRVSYIFHSFRPPPPTLFSENFHPLETWESFARRVSWPIMTVYLDPLSTHPRLTEETKRRPGKQNRTDCSRFYANSLSPRIRQKHEQCKKNCEEIGKVEAWIWRAKFLLWKILLLLDLPQKEVHRPREIIKALKIRMVPHKMAGEIGLLRERRTQFCPLWWVVLCHLFD